MMTDEGRIHPQKTLSRVILREAQLRDDVQICAQIRRNSMPGRISLTTDCAPSFFTAIEVEGYAHRVIVAESDDQIVGVGLMSKRRMFLNGIPADVGYISSLRSDKSIRNKTALVRGNHLMKQWHNEGFDVPFYLCAIMQDNLAARNVLTSGRAGLPASKDVGTLYIAAIPLFKRRCPRPPAGIRVVRGSVVGAVRIAEFMHRIGSEKQFYPVYTADDIISDQKILRGLGLDDFYVAITEDQIIGVIACWNQLPFRRTLVTGYSGSMRLLKHFIAPLTKILHMAPIPSPGEPLRNVFAACIAIAGNNQSIFELLLNTILHHEYDTGKVFLAVALMEGDPLLSVLRKYLHIPTRSCIYAMAWNGLDALAELDGRVPYIELSGL